jgi:hypothetical protein
VLPDCDDVTFIAERRRSVIGRIVFLDSEHGQRQDSALLKLF